MRNLITLIIVTSLAVSNVNANNYYLSSSNGDDNRTSAQAQNPATPWKTLNKLNSFFGNLLPGDSVLFNKGDIFYGTIIVKKSGTASFPIVLGAYGSGTKPIITGFTSVTSWTNLGGNIWESTSGVSTLSTLNIVVINGVNTAMGRWPNMGYRTITSHTSNSITDATLPGNPTYIGGQIVIRKNNFVIDRNTITNQSGNTITYTDIDPTYPVQNGWGYFIENNISTLDVQNEWYYNPSTHKIDIYSIGSPSGIQVATIDTLITATNNTYLNSNSYLTFDNLFITGANSIGFQTIGPYSQTYNTIQNCDFSFIGIAAINSSASGGFGTDHLTVNNCTINNCNDFGIDNSGGTNTIITNCTVKNIGVFPGMGNPSYSNFIGISCVGNYANISDNLIDTIGFNGIYFDGDGTQIKNNFINHFCFVKDDGGGIYCHPVGSPRTYIQRTVSYNTILNGIGAIDGIPASSTAPNQAFGIYCDGESSNIDVLNNNIANCAYYGIFFNSTSFINVNYNTVYNCTQSSFGITKYNPSRTITAISINNNFFVAKESSQKVTYFLNNVDGQTNFYTGDNNYYTRPINETNPLLAFGTLYTLTGWQAAFGQDTHSKKSPKTITNVNDLRFEYNATSTSKVVNLGATYIGIDSTIYPGTITLAPYTSAVLIYLSGTVPNQPPVANAGPDQSFFLPTNSTTLTGSGTDPDGTIASYQWTKIAGPNQFTIVSPTQAQTIINNLVQGVYQFQLMVTDNLGATGRDTVIVTVNAAPNQPPVANAGPDQNITLPTNTVTLSGSGTDPDGNIASYQWTKIAGPTCVIVSPSQAQTAINNMVQGVYQFQLTVTDNLGVTGSDTVVVTVNAAPNQPPVANAGPDQTITLPLNTVTLSGSGTDPDGTIVSYQWTKIAGPTCVIVFPSQAQTAVNNLLQGVYQFRLTVTDNLGAIGRDTVVVTVNAAPNQPPVANAGPDQTITLPVNTVTLSGSGNDPDGTIASYKWTKIAGPAQFNIVSPTQAQTVVNNLVQGVYQFELMVTDNLGATGKDTVVITVNAAPNQPPVANAGPDQTITLPLNTVTLSGSGNDPDGTIASYKWTKIAGPAQFNIVSPTQPQTVVNNLVQGVYQFELMVTDNLGATGRDTMIVTVNPAANQPPTANAGPDQTITLPVNTVTLSGSGNDPDGSIASYQWTKIAGPSCTIVSPSQAQTVVNNMLQGVYQFQLTVTDNLGATGKDTVVITVNAAPNQPPVANAGPDQTIILPVNTVTLSGSGNDPDGSIASYQWTKITGPSCTIVSPSQAQTVVNNMLQGVYQFQLTVTDNLGATGRDTVVVTVNAAANQPPVANAGPDQIITLPTNTVTLSGSGNDPDGSIASYQWTKIAGPACTIVSPSQAQTNVNNLVQGVYQFQLTVTDNLGATGKDTVVITVNAAPNQPPVANAGPDQTIILPVNTVTLSGSGNDPDGSIASYQWTKIAGPSCVIVSPSQAQTTVNNMLQGVYQFQLTVTDNLGATGKDTVVITVNAAPNQPPVANAGPDQTITLPVNTVTLSGSGNDPDGSIASYQWTKIAGPNQFTIVSPTQAQTIINNLVQGVYQFQLTVTDNLGAIGRDTVVVTVNAAPNQPPVANAGSDQNITLPVNTVTLSGSGNDPDGSIASYQWTKIAGPSCVIVSPSQAQTAVNNMLQGVYQFQLTVTDNFGATGRDTVVVTVNAASNQPPVANAGPDQTIILPVNTVTLSGSGNDPDGNISSYQWTKIAGPSCVIVSPSQAQTAVNNMLQGVYQFQLTVTDNFGATGRDTVVVTVNAASNQPPVANAGPDQTIILPVNTVTLSGSGNDPDGNISSYQWTKIAGPSCVIVSPSQAQTAVNNMLQGVYQFQLTVTDNLGATGRDTVVVTVNAAPNQPPVANAGPDQTITLPVNTVTLSGSGNDPDGSIASYQWTKIAGPTCVIVSPSQAQTAVNNMLQGVYQFQLTVTDNLGATGRDTVVVTVNAAPNQPPVANAGPDQTITLPVNTVTLSGSGTDPDGDIVSYQWTKISGPTQFTIVSPTQPQTDIINLVQGVYQFQLTVTDNLGAIGRDTVVVTVNAVPNQPPVANAGTNQSITLPSNTITLSGNGTDPDGNITSYQWTKITGPSCVIVSPSQAQTAVNNMVQGVYQFELKVIDNSGSTGKDTVMVAVNAPINQPPVANAGPNQNIFLPLNTITLTGSGTDHDGNISSYQWTKIAGPNKYSIATPLLARTNIDSLVEGTYKFELLVRDNQGAIGRDTAEIIVSTKKLPAVSIVTIFPNPASSVLNVKIDAATYSCMTNIIILSSNGTLVYQEQFFRNQQTVIRQIDVSKFAGGIYFIEIDADINNRTTLKFIKE